MEKKNVPQLRFKGFEDEWEEKALGECFTERNERSSEGDLISVTINNGIKKADELERFVHIADKTNYKVVKKGDIAYNTMRMWQGASGYSPYFGILSPAYTVLCPNENTDSLFHAYLFKKPDMIHLFEINSQGLTSDTWNLKYDAFSEIRTNITSKIEQQKIGSFLSKIDSLIQAKTQKLESLKSVKKSLLKKCFPKDGEKVPQMRFERFSEEWEEKKLGEICEIIMGQSPDGSTYSDKPSAYILVQGNADMKDGFVCPRVWTTQKTKCASKGDLIFSVRAPVGEVGKTEFDVVIGRGVASIRGNEFIFQYLKKMNEFGYWDSISCGSTFESINSDGLKNAIVKIPSITEQQKIGEFFSKYDSLISLQQKEIENLKTIKKSLLQKMFV